MSEVRFLAYYMYGGSGQDRIELPIPLLTYITTLNFQDRWDGSLNQGDCSRNLKSYKWLSGLRGQYLFGTLVEVVCREKIELLKLDDGSDEELPIPSHLGEQTTWDFIIAPHAQLIIVELKGRGIENKLTSFFNRHIEIYNKNKDRGETDISFIELEAVAINQQASTYMRDRPIGSFEALIDASKVEVNSNWGLTLPLLQNLPEQARNLKIKITISPAGRGEPLPAIVASQLADIVEAIADTPLKRASVKGMMGKRRQERPTQLFDPIYSATLDVHDKADCASMFAKAMDGLLDALRDPEED